MPYESVVVIFCRTLIDGVLVARATVDLAAEVGRLHRGLEGHLQLNIFGVGSNLSCGVFRHKIVMLLVALRCLWYLHGLLLRCKLLLLLRLVLGTVTHLGCELLLSRRHLSFTAASDHASAWLLAIRLRLGRVGIGTGLVLGRLGGSRSCVGSDYTHSANGLRLLKSVHDIASSGLTSSSTGTIWLLEVLHREVDNSASNLHGLVKAGQKWCSLFDQNECSKLALVVLKEEFSSLELNFRVAS